MVLLQYYDCTKYLIYTNITNSPLLFNFEIFVTFLVVGLVERATRKI